MRRAQVEILGLTLIVMFISLGVLFLLKFNVLKTPNDVKANYVHSELASSTLSALLVTNVHECKGVNIRDLLIDCAEGESVRCDGNANPNSCDYSKSVIHDIMDDTLVTWKKDYKFTAWTEGDPPWVEDDPTGTAGSKCPGERKSALFFFEAETRGTLFIRLDICT